jgi:hypothetical protein
MCIFATRIKTNLKIINMKSQTVLNGGIGV